MTKKKDKKRKNYNHTYTVNDFCAYSDLSVILAV